jgi:hypothetical protein
VLLNLDDGKQLQKIKTANQTLRAKKRERINKIRLMGPSTDQRLVHSVDARTLFDDDFLGAGRDAVSRVQGHEFVPLLPARPTIIRHLIQITFQRQWTWIVAPESFLDAHSKPDDADERKGAQDSGHDVYDGLMFAAFGDGFTFGRLVNCQS